MWMRRPFPLRALQALPGLPFLALLLGLLLALGLLAGCGGGGGSSSPAPQPSQDPHITSFAASAATVTAGDSAALTAVFERGTGLVTPGNLPVTSGVALDLGAVNATTTYTLTVTGAAGTTPATATATVTVVPAPAITSFTATPSTVAAGGTSALKAVFSGGTGRVTPGNLTITSGVDLAVGPLNATTAYTLTVTNAAGTHPATAQATVTVTGGGGGSQSVSGTVTYDFVPATYDVASHSGGLIFASAVQKPVRGAVVLMVEGTTVLANATTDQAGHYTLTYTPTGAGTLQVVALATSASPSIIVQDNTDGGAPWGIGATLAPGTTTLNLHATHGWTGSAYNPAARLAAPFAILDSMYTASRAFIAARPAVVFPELKVNWSSNNVPQSGNKALGQIGTSHFSPAENQIYILGKEGADTDEFDSHVIVHEWAHYFERNLSRSDSPGGPHGAGDVLDPRLAFGEGYGNGLAAMLLPESVYTDTLWSSGVLRAFGFDAESAPAPTDDPQPGVFSESTVMRVLYDIFDGGSNEGFDGLQTGLGPIYDVLVGPERTTDALTTLGSFVAGLKAQAGVNVSALDTLLAHYQIGPITTAWGDGDAGLRAMYVAVGSLPYAGSVALDGGLDPNKWGQNQYFVVTGNGAAITVRTTCAQDVDVTVYQAGTVVASGLTTSGNETVAFTSQAAKPYVVVLTGYGATAGAYSVQVQITTP
jgi:hypothetical protein